MWLNPKECTALYFKNKIEYCPTHYNFKDRLFVSGDDVCGVQYSMRCFDYDDELTLGAAVLEHLASSGSSYDNVSIHAAPELDFTDAFGNVRHVLDSSSLSPYWMIYYNGLRINPANIYSTPYFPEHSYKEAAKIDAFRKQTVMVNAFIKLGIALHHDYSIAKNLGWLCSEYKDARIETVDNLSWLEDALNTGDVSKFKMLAGDTPMSVMGFHNGTDSALSENVFKFLYAKMLCYIPELWWAIQSINVLEEREFLEREFYKAFELKYDPLGTLGTLYLKTPAEVNDELKHIATLNTRADRYEAVKEFVATHKIYDISAKLAKEVKSGTVSTIISEFLRQMLMYIDQLWFIDVRTKQMLLLMEYARKNNCMPEYDTESMEKLYSMFGSAMGDDAMEAMFGESKPSNILGSSRDSKYGPEDTVKSEKAETHKDKATPLLEALDRANSSFEAGGYDFETSDEIVTESDATYNSIAANAKLICSDFTKRVKEIRTYNVGGKNSGKSNGKLDRKNLWKYHTDHNIFYDNTYKLKESDLAFGIILDVSGSMHGDGIRNGKATMIILHETLKTLGINHSIITHTSHGHHHCIIKRYQAFKEDKQYAVTKNYALAGIKSCSGNCDSAALYYMEHAFSRVHNKDKICMIFSDGEPTECSDTELKDQVRRMERKGIKVIGIGIDFPTIAEYYTEYANGANLKEMLDIVANILKQYVLEKPD